MAGCLFVASREFRELARSPAAAVVAVLAAAMALAAGAGSAALAAAGLSTAPLLHVATILPFLVPLWSLAGPTLAAEKASGRLETLLATPLDLRSLWLAKGLALFLPGLAAAALSAAAVAIGAGLGGALAAPEVSRPAALPAGFLAVCLLGHPLLFSGLAALTAALAFGKGTETAILPSFVLGFGLPALLPAGMALGLVDIASPGFAASYFGAGCLGWAAALALARGLTKEGIVLSGRDS